MAAQTPALDLDDDLKRRAPGRWLALRLVSDRIKRAEISALALLDLEFALATSRSENPLMGEIRLAWWRERIEGHVDGTSARSHPALEALAHRLSPGAFPTNALLAALEARHAELSRPWFEDEAALDHFVEAQAGLVLAGARLIDGSAPAEAILTYGRFIALARLSRLPHQDWRPAEWAAAEEADRQSHLAHKLDDLLRDARTAPPIPAASLPAIAEASLLAGREPGPLRQRLRLMRASLSGRP